MHELGIVFHIIRSVEKVAVENGLEKVSAVVLELGEVSGVVPDYLADCWRWAACCWRCPPLSRCWPCVISTRAALWNSSAPRSDMMTRKETGYGEHLKGRWP